MSNTGTPYHRESTYFGNTEVDAEQEAERAARFRARDAEYRAALRIPDHVRLPRALGLTNHAHGDDDRRRQFLGGGVEPRHLIAAP